MRQTPHRLSSASSSSKRFSVSWPIDSALVSPSTTNQSLITDDNNNKDHHHSPVLTPLTRAKARWLLHRGAIDSEVAKVSVQTSATWAAACDLLVRCCFEEYANTNINSLQQSNTNSLQQDLQDSNSPRALLTKMNPSSSSPILSSSLVETLTHRLLQEVRTRNTTALSAGSSSASASAYVGLDPLHFLEGLHRQQIEQNLNSIAAEEVDLQPKDAWIDEGLVEKDNDNDEVDQEQDEDDNTATEKDMMDNTTSGTSSKIVDLPFSVALSRANTGTIRSNSDNLVKKIVEFCDQQQVPNTPTIFTQLSLLPMDWSTSLWLVSKAEKDLTAGAPAQVIESAMRSCVAFSAKSLHNSSFTSATIHQQLDLENQLKIAARTLKLYDKLTKEEDQAESEGANNKMSRRKNIENVSTTAVSYAFHALSALSIKRRNKLSHHDDDSSGGGSAGGLVLTTTDEEMINSSASVQQEETKTNEQVKEKEKEKEEDEEKKKSQQKTTTSSSSSAIALANNKSHWQWTLQLHNDTVMKNAETKSWFLCGEAGANLFSSSLFSAASAGNWSLALSLLSKNTTFSMMNNENTDNSSSKTTTLLVPDADSLAMTISACARAGRFEEVQKLIEFGGKLFSSPEKDADAENKKQKNNKQKTKQSKNNENGSEQDDDDEFADIFGDHVFAKEKSSSATKTKTIGESLKEQRMKVESTSSSTNNNELSPLFSGDATSGTVLLTAVHYAFSSSSSSLGNDSNNNNSSSPNQNKRRTRKEYLQLQALKRRQQKQIDENNDEMNKLEEMLSELSSSMNDDRGMKKMENDDDDEFFDLEEMLSLAGRTPTSSSPSVGNTLSINNSTNHQSEDSSSISDEAISKASIFRSMKPMFVSMLPHSSNWTIHHCLALAIFAERGATAIVRQSNNLMNNGTSVSSLTSAKYLLTSVQKENLLTCLDLALAAFEEYKTLSETMQARFVLAVGRVVGYCRSIDNDDESEDTNNSVSKRCNEFLDSLAPSSSSSSSSSSVAELALFQVLDLTLETEKSMRDPSFLREATGKILMLRVLPFIRASILLTGSTASSSSTPTSFDEGFTLLKQTLNDNRVPVGVNDHQDKTNSASLSSSCSSSALLLRTVLRMKVGLFSTKNQHQHQKRIQDFFTNQQKNVLRRFVGQTVSRALSVLRSRQQLIASDKDKSYQIVQEAENFYNSTCKYDPIIEAENQQLPRILLHIKILYYKSHFPGTLHHNQQEETIQIAEELLNLYEKQLPSVRNHNRALKLMLLSTSSSSSSTILTNRNHQNHHHDDEVQEMLKHLIPDSVNKIRLVLFRFLAQRYPEKFPNEEMIVRYLLKRMDMNNNNSNNNTSISTSRGRDNDRRNMNKNETIKTNREEKQKEELVKKTNNKRKQNQMMNKKKPTGKMNAGMFDRF